MTQQHSQPKSTETILKNAFAAAVAVADPQVIVPQYLAKIFPAGQEPTGRCLVVGAGKASASMASALEAYAREHWPQAKIEGVVLTRYGHSAPTSHIKIVEAGHPVPDQAGMNGAKAILELTQTLKENDVLIALVSGGGSSLLTLPVEGISIDDMRKTTEALLRSGAPIEEMNVVRKHLSAILGGNLARCAIARDARVEALLISDVTGDAPADIASGPCAADYSTYLDALNIIESYHLQGLIPVPVMTHLKQGVAGQKPETLKDIDLVGARVSNHVIATAYKSLEAAANYVKDHGYEPVVLGDTITGEAQAVGVVQAQLAREYLAKTNQADKPIALISGGDVCSGERVQPGQQVAGVSYIAADSAVGPRLIAVTEEAKVQFDQPRNLSDGVVVELQRLQTLFGKLCPNQIMLVEADSPARLKPSGLWLPGVVQ
mgnify:CR=1 FL=1